MAPPSPLIKGEVGPSKNWVTWGRGGGGGGGVPNLDHPGGGVTLKRAEQIDVEMGGCHFFSTLQFNYIYCMCVGKVKFPLLRFNSSVF